MISIIEKTAIDKDKPDNKSKFLLDNILFYFVRKIFISNVFYFETLITQNEDYFKKFIAVTANYNTLQNFLSHMPVVESNDLMCRFVRDLDIAPTLEDAVDVVDAFSSISDTSLQNLMLSEIRKNKNNRLYQTIDALCTAAIQEKNTNATIESLQNTFGLLNFNTLRNNQKNVIIIGLNCQHLFPQMN